MKQRGTAALILALAVIAAGVLGSFFWSFSRQNQEQYQITLPGHGTAEIDHTHEIGQSNRETVEVLTVTRDNVAEVIRQLQRPERYQCQMESVYYYGETAAVLKSTLQVRQEQLRITQYDSGETPVLQALLTRDRVYLWDEGDTWADLPRMENDRDLYARFPTYEDILALPPEQILEGGVEEWNGALCIYVRTGDPDTGEEQQWYILAETGLLFYTETTRDGEYCYTGIMRQFSMQEPSTDRFLLPDGSLPE